MNINEYGSIGRMFQMHPRPAALPDLPRRRIRRNAANRVPQMQGTSAGVLPMHGGLYTAFLDRMRPVFPLWGGLT